MAGDLDSAKQFLNCVHDRLGYAASPRTWTQIDSTTDALTALNSAIRSVAVDMGVVGHDTITVVANTYFYALVSTYMDKELPHLPLQVFLKPVEGDLKGLWRAKSRQFGEAPGVTAGWVYALAGDRIWIYPAGEDGDKVFIEGPLEGTTFSHGGSTTNISEEDKIAVIYRAVALLARGKERHLLADYYEGLYDKHLRLVRGAGVVAAP